MTGFVLKCFDAAGKEQDLYSDCAAEPGKDSTGSFTTGLCCKSKIWSWRVFFAKYTTAVDYAHQDSIATTQSFGKFGTSPQNYDSAWTVVLTVSDSMYVVETGGSHCTADRGELYRCPTSQIFKTNEINNSCIVFSGPEGICSRNKRGFDSLQPSESRRPIVVVAKFFTARTV